MPPRYFRVRPSFWTAAKAWDDKTRVAGLYVLTSPHCHSEGLYALPKGYIEADLGYSIATITKSLQRLQLDGFIRYDDKAGVVLIPDALEIQAPTTRKQIQGAISRLRMVPPTPLLWELHSHANAHANGLAEAMREEFEIPFEYSSPSPNPLGTNGTVDPSSLARVERRRDFGKVR